MTASSPSDKISLEFSEKYDPEHAQHYLDKHQSGFASRLSNWRDIQMARKALRLAGNPASVLDLPCGAGRFWSMLAEQSDRNIIGADNSASMVAMAIKSQPASVVARVRPMQTSAFAIDLPDKAVDCVFSIRLMHHIGQADHRLKMLHEFHRVTRDTVILSLWVDGNFKAWKRKRLETKRAAKYKNSSYQNRFVIPAEQIESEFKQAGFSVVSSIDFLPAYAMWRIYVLRKTRVETD
jgi:ubiquinone/menaquinone biosynthesis C-methylase UbiE